MSEGKAEVVVEAPGVTIDADGAASFENAHIAEDATTEPDEAVDGTDTTLDGIDEEIKQQIEELAADLGEDNLTEIVVDAALDETIAAFVLDAETRMREVSKEMSGKARYFMHREPNNDLYILRTLKPSDFSSAWITLLSGHQEAYERYSDQMLEAVMLYPSYDETDWDYTGNKMHAPDGLTKSRLLNTYFFYTLPDPEAPQHVAFTSKDLDFATKAARKTKKPGL